MELSVDMLRPRGLGYLTTLIARVSDQRRPEPRTTDPRLTCSRSMSEALPRSQSSTFSTGQYEEPRSNMFRSRGADHFGHLIEITRYCDLG
jgi:hypothetical protein